ncbi:MAG TPA: glycogen-binding domain-containing protein [bacterium]|nr:glycogen-binding domain-containing protein [bacterium]
MKDEIIARWRQWLGEEFSEAELSAFFQEHPEAAEDPAGWIEAFRRTREAIPPLSPDFTRRVMSRLPTAAPAAVLPLRRPAWRRWALASGLAAAAALSLIWYRSDRPAYQFPGAEIRQAAGPDGQAVYFVRFAIESPDVKEVALAGDFNQWTPVTLSPSAEKKDRFTVELPLAAGIYSYAFVVDGKKWIVDESAGPPVEDGFGERNSVLRL